MNASVLDLRRKMSDVLRALEANESVTILHRGKEKGVIHPTGRKSNILSVAQHPAFGMWKERNDLRDVRRAVRMRKRGAMLFDTDVLIWVLRGNRPAAKIVETSDERRLSVVTYMELLQGSRDRQEAKTIKEFLADFSFRTMARTENIGHCAAIYMEEYGIRAAMCVADALVAATAVEMQLTLCTGNRKHYSPIRELDIRVFRP